MTKATKIVVVVLAALVVFAGGFAIAAGRSDRSSSYGSMMNGSMMGNGSMMNGSMMGNGSMMNGSMMGNGANTTPAPFEGAQQVTVTANDLRFSPSTLDLATGERVNVTFKNDDKIVHDFTLPSVGIHATAQAGQQVTFGLSVPTAGTYPFLCTVAGHAAAGMQGSIVVGS